MKRVNSGLFGVANHPAILCLLKMNEIIPKTFIITPQMELFSIIKFYDIGGYIGICIIVLK